MAEIGLIDALDGAQLVKVDAVGGYPVVQCWYGGTQVRVFVTDTNTAGTWEETDVWTVSDEQGEPVSRSEIAKHMAMHYEALEVEAEMRGVDG